MSEARKDQDLGFFSGETTRCDIPKLVELFGRQVPVEAVNLVFDAPADMTLGEARANLADMAKVWDQPKYWLQRLTKGLNRAAESVAAAHERLREADETQRVHMIAELADATDCMEAAADDLSFLRGESDC